MHLYIQSDERGVVLDVCTTGGKVLYTSTLLAACEAFIAGVRLGEAQK